MRIALILFVIAVTFLGEIKSLCSIFFLRFENEGVEIKELSGLIETLRNEKSRFLQNTILDVTQSHSFTAITSADRAQARGPAKLQKSPKRSEGRIDTRSSGKRPSERLKTYGEIASRKKSS